MTFFPRSSKIRFLLMCEMERKEYPLRRNPGSEQAGIAAFLDDIGALECGNVVIKKCDLATECHNCLESKMRAGTSLCIGNPHFAVDFYVDNRRAVNRRRYVL